MNRRRFLAASALAGSAALAGGAEGAAPEGAGTTPPEVTRILAKYVVSAKPADLPEPVRKEAMRTLLNWFAATLGGAKNEAVGIAAAALAPFFGNAQAHVVGRTERPDMLNAALLNGMSSHILDYDDTHLKTVIHPAGPVVPAILALSEYLAGRSENRKFVAGRDFMNALVLGIEAECRIGNAVYPEHYDAGWHITGTVGPFGAAVAAGKILGLDEQQMVWALGIAAVQPVGLREMFGSMTKSFHPGRAAQNGLLAALLAQKNFTSSDQGIEAKSGWANVLSTKRNYAEITENLGKTYEISVNTYKPFACGIVMHPTIDGCIQLREQTHFTPDDVKSIDLRVNRLVLELTAIKAPKTGLEGKFSIYYAAAVAIVEGSGSELQFSDASVKNPVTVALREKVTATADSSVAEDQVRITITLKDGRKLEKFVEHAVGSVKNPMSDHDLEVKFAALSDDVLSSDQAEDLMEMCWKLETLPDASQLAKNAAGKA
ncbi:MAG TPA: MmgE/PrpD family protein [Bryobacteraceae bacterium]|nr:MmgE/PrpD family protein [Bryobacteraceae bacterium]